MEIAITINADVLNRAMQTAKGQTQRQIVEDALRLFAVKTNQDMAGKCWRNFQLEGNRDELRMAKWSLAC